MTCVFKFISAYTAGLRAQSSHNITMKEELNSEGDAEEESGEISGCWSCFVGVLGSNSLPDTRTGEGINTAVTSLRWKAADIDQIWS